jgi:integrase
LETRRKKNGSIVYREKVYINGQAVKSIWFNRITDARNWKARTITERHQQIASGITYNPKTTFEDFATKWFEERIKVRTSLRTQDAYRFELKNHLLPLLAKIPLGSINHQNANLLIAKLKDKELSNKSINNIVNTLKAILNMAVRWDYIPKNPLLGFQTLKVNPNTFKYWTTTEILQFLRANLNHPLYYLWVVMLNTGMRKGEALGLWWDRTNLSLGQIEISRTIGRYGLQEHTKTYEKRILPINDEVKKVLLELFKRQLNPHFVFTSPEGEQLDYHHVTREFIKAQKKAGMTNVIRLHDTRHTFASQFMMHGGNVFTLQKLLGHKSVNMTMKYAHLADNYLRDAVGIISFSGEEKIDFSPKTAPKEETVLQVIGI